MNGECSHRDLFGRSFVWAAISCAFLAGCATTERGAVAGAKTPSGAVEERARLTDEQLGGVTDMTPAAREMESAENEIVDRDTWESFGKPEYRISAGDVLAFRSYSDDVLSVPEVTVRFDGCVSLPLVNEINVAGRTREEAQEVVEEAYRSVFKNPQVGLTVVQAAGQSYYVMGDVNRPSEYPYIHSLNILQAINTAGGMRDRSQSTGESYEATQGSLSVAYIIRHNCSERRVLQCDLTGITKTGPHPSQIVIWPGDVVYVPEGVNLVYVMGAVQRASVFRLVEGDTLLQVLVRSGGLIDNTAYKRRVVIIRPVAEGQNEVMLVNVREMLKKGNDIPLQGGDIIYVPTKPLLRLQEFVERFTGSITPLLSLYTDAYDAWYTQKRFDLLFKDAETGTESTLSVLEGLRSFGDWIGSTTN